MYRNICFFIICMALYGCAAIYWHRTGKLTARKKILLLTFISFQLRFMYIMYTGIYVRQHDVGTIGCGHSHIGYIEYILHNCSLPDFDPRSVLQFYHPPLHYIISAVWVRFNLIAGADYYSAFENIQLLTLFYTIVINLAALRIFSEFRLKGRALITSYAIVCFHPTLIIMSGSINNDILSVMFMVLSVMYTLRWYRERSTAAIIKAGLSVAFAVLSKTSGILVAPAIAVLFLYVLVTDKAARKKTFCQLLIFALCAIPLGVSWTVYNLVKYGMPAGYVIRMGNDSWQYIGEHSMISRFFSSEIIVPKSCFIKWQNGTEFNILASVLKTSAFGEFTLHSGGIGVILCYLLYYANFALVLISIAGMVFMFIKCSFLPRILKFFVFVLYITLIGSFTSFCFSFPHTCTMNIRYIVPAIIIGALCIGILQSRLQPNSDESGGAAVTLPSKRFSLCISAVTVSFCILSTSVYTLLGALQ